MVEINLLKKASLADKLGNYKLADNLYNKALRMAGVVSAAEKSFLRQLR